MLSTRQLMPYLNPWMGKGTKWPDANAADSSTLTVTTYVYKTPASGYSVFRIYPGNLATLYYTSPTGANPVTSWGGGLPCANYSNLTSSYVGYRVVSAGVNVRYVGNVMYNSGYITARDSVVAAHTATSAPLSSSDYSSQLYLGPYKDGFTWVARRTGVEAEHYDPLNKTVDDNWTALSVWIQGCDNTTPQSYIIEIVQNLELLPTPGTILAQSASPAAQQDLRLTTAVHNIQARDPFQ
jgi:hypothetical protein